MTYSVLKVPLNPNQPTICDILDSEYFLIVAEKLGNFSWSSVERDA